MKQAPASETRTKCTLESVSGACGESESDLTPMALTLKLYENRPHPSLTQLLPSVLYNRREKLIKIGKWE